MTLHKQLRVIKALNKLSNKYRGLIKKRDLPTVSRISRLRSLVPIRDILLLLRNIFELRKQRTTHFALDLYLVLLLGQRYQSDRLRIEEGVLKLLNANKDKEDNNLELTFQITIGKTKSVH